jgi:predicted transcriptional regulator
MRVLWERKRATVADVLEHIERSPGERASAYNTILTLLTILERKGYVVHEKEGRAFAYVPQIEQREARKNALSNILHRFFDDSPELLVLDLLGHAEADAEERRRIRELLGPAPPERRAPSRRRPKS